MKRRVPLRWRVVVLTGLIATSLTGSPRTGLAQASIPRWTTTFNRSEPDPLATPPMLFQDEVTCPQCNPPKRFWAGAGELMIVQAIPWAFTRYVRDGEWARIGPESWITNLKFPWQWDNNKFGNNQFAHPYHGSLYYNTGRTNGYNFWASAPWAFGGSLMWELFGEVWAPAPNDFFNTSLGGITLGEMLFRFSSLTLNNQARGTNRAVRELGATLIDPVRGFNRFVRGEMNDITETPPDWRPSRVQALMDVGYRRFSTTGDVTNPDGLDQTLISFSVVYGRQMTDLNKAPFSAFRVVGSLASNSGTRGAVAELRVRGNLGATSLGRDSTRFQLAGFMTYDYISNEVIDFGGQGFLGGAIVQSDNRKPVMFHGELQARFMPIAAVRSDYFVTAEGRDYDYGVGLGGRAEADLIFSRKGVLTVSGGYTLVPVVSGFPGNHHLYTFNTEARGYLWGKIGIGANYNRVWRRSNYTFNPDVSQDMSEVRTFISLTIPRWEE